MRQIVRFGSLSLVQSSFSEKTYTIFSQKLYNQDKRYLHLKAYSDGDDEACFTTTPALTVIREKSKTGLM